MGVSLDRPLMTAVPIRDRPSRAHPYREFSSNPTILFAHIPRIAVRYLCFPLLFIRRVQGVVNQNIVKMFLFINFQLKAGPTP